MSQQNVELVQSAYAAFGRGDIESLFKILDENIVFNLAENSPCYAGRPLQGRQELMEKLFSRIPADTDNFGVVVDKIRDGGDMIVALGRYTGRNRKTGLDLNAQMCHIWTVSNGRLIRMDQYLDTLRSAEVFGTIGRGAAA